MESTHEIAQAYHGQNHGIMFEETPPHGESANWSGNNNNNNHNHLRTSVDDEGLNLYTEGLGMESNSGRAGSGRFSSPKYTRRSMDDSLVATDARMNRIANAEAAMRQEIYKECTFRPNIKDLPSSYGAKKELDVPFHTRVTKWKKEKEQSLETKSKIILNGEKAACTFHPKINRNSDKCVKDIRGPDASADDASVRLYKNSEQSMQQRMQAINEIREKEELALQQECTFKPQLITKNATVHQAVQSKFTLPSTPKLEVAPVDAKICTFTPKVSSCAVVVVVVVVWCCIS